MGMNAPPPGAVPAKTDPTDITRLAINASIVVASFVAVVVVVGMVFNTAALKNKDGVLEASTVVAIIGAVTTFLGTAVGVFFGVNVGQAGQAAATQAATSSANAATAASNAAKSAVDATTQTSTKLSDVSSAVSALVDQVPQATLDAMPKMHRESLLTFKG